MTDVEFYCLKEKIDNQNQASRGALDSDASRTAGHATGRRWALSEAATLEDINQVARFGRQLFGHGDRMDPVPSLLTQANVRKLYVMPFLDAAKQDGPVDEKEYVNGFVHGVVDADDESHLECANRGIVHPFAR